MKNKSLYEVLENNFPKEYTFISLKYKEITDDQAELQLLDQMVNDKIPNAAKESEGMNVQKQWEEDWWWSEKD